MQQVRIERRKYRRFQAPVGAFIVLGPDSTKLGAIVDVSIAGLGFRHVDRREPFDGLSELDMFHINNGLFLKNVPFETIWDLEWRKGLLGFMITRRSGVQFGDLTHTQRSQLEDFILNYTTAVHLDRPDLRAGPRQPHYLPPFSL